MHPSLQYQLAQTFISDRIAAAHGRPHSVTPAPDRDRPGCRGLLQLMSPCRRLARRMTRPAGLSTGR